MARTIKPYISCFKWRAAMMYMKQIRKSVRLAHRMTGRVSLTNRQIRHIIIVAHQAKKIPTPHDVATLQRQMNINE